jgi:tetratricopeptide (TPR) repeat protein
MLYELLAGTTPVEKETLDRVGLDELRRLIREEAPETLSNRARRTRRNVTGVRAGVSPRVPAVSADLDCIVGKCLQKDRNRRYESASSLVADIQHYLSNEPVQACPRSRIYRLQKFMRKYQARLMTGGILLAAALIVLIVGGFSAWTRERQRRTYFQQVGAALQEAAVLRDESKWTPALVAAKRAESLTTSFSSKPELASQARLLRRDIEVAASLEEIRLRATGIRDGKGLDGSNDVIEEVNADFLAAFRAADIDLDSLGTVETGRRVRHSAIRNHLLAALDHWARLLTESETHKHTWSRLLQAARAADTNEFHNQVRLAVEQADRAALKSISKDERITDLLPATLDLLAIAVRWLGTPDDTLALLHKAQRRYPDDYWINTDLARQASHPDKLRFFTAALALRPQSPNANIHVAYALMQMGRYDEAVPIFKHGIELAPGYAHAHDVLGQCYSYMKRYKEAIAAYEESLRLSPNTATQVRLAALYADCADASLRNPHRAVQLAQRFVEFRPSRSDGWYNLGVAQCRAGDYRTAIDTLQKFRELQLREGSNPADDGFDFYFLSMAHWQLGQEDEARRWFDRGAQWWEQNRPGSKCLGYFEAGAMLKIPGILGVFQSGKETN